MHQGPPFPSLIFFSLFPSCLQLLFFFSPPFSLFFLLFQGLNPKASIRFKTPPELRTPFSPLFRRHCVQKLKNPILADPFSLRLNFNSGSEIVSQLLYVQLEQDISHGPEKKEKQISMRNGNWFGHLVGLRNSGWVAPAVIPVASSSVLVVNNSVQVPYYCIDLCKYA